jgi:hypothetical protein
VGLGAPYDLSIPDPFGVPEDLVMPEEAEVGLVVHNRITRLVPARVTARGARVMRLASNLEADRLDEVMVRQAGSEDFGKVRENHDGVLVVDVTSHSDRATVTAGGG